MTYGEHARAARMKAGYSAYQLGEKAGVAKSTVLRIERDRGYPNFGSLYAITRALNIGIDQYLGIKPTHLVWDHADSFGKQARRCRIRRGFSIDKLSADAGVSATTIRGLETDALVPSIYSLLAPADALDISPDEYLGLPCPRERMRV